jgi:hypothetical protein
MPNMPAPTGIMDVNVGPKHDVFLQDNIGNFGAIGMTAMSASFRIACELIYLLSFLAR